MPNVGDLGVPVLAIHVRDFAGSSTEPPVSTAAKATAEGKAALPLMSRQHGPAVLRFTCWTAGGTRKRRLSKVLRIAEADRWLPATGRVATSLWGSGP